MISATEHFLELQYKASTESNAIMSRRNFDSSYFVALDSLVLAITKLVSKKDVFSHVNNRKTFDNCEEVRKITRR